MQSDNMFGADYVTAAEPPAPAGVPSRYIPGDDWAGADGGCGGSGRAAMRAAIIAVVAILVIILIVRFALPRTVARRLTRAGWLLYTKTGCGYCVKQKELLGDDFKQIVECGQAKPGGGLVQTGGVHIAGDWKHPAPPCNSASIRGFPYWFNIETGETRTGLQGLEALAEMAK